MAVKVTPFHVSVTTDTMAQQFVIKSADIVLHFTMPGTLTNFSNRLCCMENLYSGYKTVQSLGVLATVLHNVLLCPFKRLYHN